MTVVLVQALVQAQELMLMLMQRWAHVQTIATFVASWIRPLGGRRLPAPWQRRSGHHDDASELELRYLLSPPLYNLTTTHGRAQHERRPRTFTRWARIFRSLLEKDFFLLFLVIGGGWFTKVSSLQ